MIGRQFQSRIVVLSGAGLSAESGLSTFRDAGGVWSRYDIRDVATPEGFLRDPSLVHTFYNARRMKLRQVKPNAAHCALAKLEDVCELAIITQNVDDLHERAGSHNVIHMHGELLSAICHNCGHRWPSPDELSADDICGRCGAQSVRPDVVWFGEIPYHLERINDLLLGADLFVSIGTSGAVSPANTFVSQAKSAGAKTIELNLESTEISDCFDDHRLGPATEIVPVWVDELMARGLHWR